MNLVWTSTPPTNHEDRDDVYYWCRLPGWHTDRVVMVQWVSRFDSGEEEWVLAFGEERMGRMPVADAPAGTLWAGPIPEPTGTPAGVPQ